jgi:ankyrin repeat protein
MSDLHIAAKNGNVEEVRRLIESGADVNEKDQYGNTPLHSSINELVDIELPELLITHGADVNEKDQTGRAPIHLATNFQHKKLVELLIEHGADINMGGELGWTPLHEASHGSFDMMRFLVEHGADVNVQDDSGSTPLHNAVSRGSPKPIEFLVKHCANIYTEDKYGDKPIRSLDRRNSRNAEEHKKMEQLLKSGVEEGCATKLLFDEVKKGNIKVVESLIEDKADVNAKDSSGYTPLHWAVDKKCKEAAQLLIDNGADVSANDNYGWKILHWAKDVGIVDLLIKHNADVNAKDNSGYTLLHWAAKSGYGSIVEFLIGHGADIVKGKDGKMPSELATNESIREKLKNYEKAFEKDQKDKEKEEIKAALEGDLKETQEKLKEVMDEKTTALEKLLKLQKDMRELQDEQPILEKVLLEMKEEFGKCNLAKSLDKAVQELEEIQSELTPYAYYSASLTAKKLGFDGVIDELLSNPKLLDNASIKSKTLNAVDGMLNMFKTCGAQSEEKLYSITDKIGYIKDNMPEIADAPTFITGDDNAYSYNSVVFA